VNDRIETSKERNERHILRLEFAINELKELGIEMGEKVKEVIEELRKKMKK